MCLKSTAILLLSHLSHTPIIEEYRKLSRAAGDSAVTYLLLHAKADDPIEEECKDRIHPFSSEDLKTLGYRSFDGSITPGSAHLPLLYFFSRHSDYDYYWLVEYDVRFSGDWRVFFDCFERNNSDFLSTHLRHYSEKREWPWWRNLNHPRISIPLEERLRSFNPIYRISTSALKYLHQSHRQGWCGHFEVLVPTLLYHGGFKLEDIGGDGMFTPPDRMNRFYREADTFRWRPVFSEVGLEMNKLYHPVKVH
jgi:hypothetical protein